MNSYARQAKEYRYQEVMGASPIGLIIIAYDAAITACGRRDLAGASRALSALRNSLNFEYGDIASRLFAIYLWCADLTREGKWDEAAGILSELREAWAQAERRIATPRPVPQDSVFAAPAQAVAVP